MKNKIILLPIALIIFLASCSTSYKNTQTVDDVYYSPVKNVSEVQKEDNYDRNEERQMRMSTRDPRWRNLDYQYDYDYNYNPYKYGYGYGYYYNPYYYAYPVYYYPGLSYINSTNNSIRMTNLGAYTPSSTPVKDLKTGESFNIKTTNSNIRTSNLGIYTPSLTPGIDLKNGEQSNTRGMQPYNNSNTGGTRRVINSSSDNNSNSNDTRTYSPSSPVRSSSGSGSGSTNITRPSRH